MWWLRLPRLPLRRLRMPVWRLRRLWLRTVLLRARLLPRLLTGDAYRLRIDNEDFDWPGSTSDPANLFFRNNTLTNTCVKQACR